MIGASWLRRNCRRLSLSMDNNSIKMKRSNIILYDSGLCMERKPQTRDVVWFREKIPSHGVALDCGSGFGYYLCSLGCEKIGLDISARQLSKMKIVDGRIQPVRGDVEYLPFQRGSIDYVLAFGLLHHLPNKERGLDEMCRVLKRRGYFFVMDSNLDGLGPVYLIWRLTMIGYNLRGRFAEGMYPKLPRLEQYLKLKGFSFDVKAEQSFLFCLSCLLDLYFSYLPQFAALLVSPLRRILLRADHYVSRLLPYEHRLSMKIVAELDN
jgi:SAM-dependent methyltransferase